MREHALAKAAKGATREKRRSHDIRSRGAADDASFDAADGGGDGDGDGDDPPLPWRRDAERQTKATAERAKHAEPKAPLEDEGVPDSDGGETAATAAARRGGGKPEPGTPEPPLAAAAADIHSHEATDDASFDGADDMFDDDDDGDDPRPPPHRNGERKREAEAEPDKRAARRAPPHNGGAEVPDSDGDGDDDHSFETFAELITPRPCKKEERKPGAAAATAAGKGGGGGKPEPGKPEPPRSVSSRLLTPCAFSPAALSPTLGAYAAPKGRVPAPPLPALPPSLVREIGGKLYPDLRHNFVVVLTSHARRLRHAAHQRATFDAALRSVVVIG
jgi:hypothetical protein